MDPLTPLHSKAHSIQQIQQSLPIHMIVGFFNIKFTNDSRNLTLPSAIHTFIRNENRVMNLSPTHKAILSLKNQLI